VALSSLEIARKAGLQLNDREHVTWGVPELAAWINAGCRELVNLKPTALTVGVGMRLAAGTRQSLDGATFVDPLTGAALPWVALQALDAVRNLGATGTAPGLPVTALERRIMDVALPGWHTLPAASVVRHVMFDPREPKAFYNYPPVAVDPAVYLELIVARLPVNALVDDAMVLGVDDIDPGLDERYEMALVDYVLFRAYGKDAESPVSLERSRAHQQQFMAALGAKLRNETALSPDGRRAAGE
jgi:hypothetical protein